MTAVIARSFRCGFQPLPRSLVKRRLCLVGLGFQRIQAFDPHPLLFTEGDDPVLTLELREGMIGLRQTPARRQVARPSPSGRAAAASARLMLTDLGSQNVNQPLVDLLGQGGVRVLYRDEH